MAWAQGTDATNNLKTVLEAWLSAQFAASPYKARLPRRHIAVGSPNSSKKISGSIKVLLYTGKDDQMPWEFETTDGRVMEEFQIVTIDVQSDERGAKADEDAQVASIIRQLISTPAQRDTLAGLGVYNVRETTEALLIDGVEFKRPITFKCSTDVLI